MGTRSTVRFFNEFAQEQPILSVYQQFDGYISGVGHELANWLKGKKMINGINGQTMEAGFANNMGCLAAQYVAAHKVEIGGFYLTSHDNMQGYDYEVRYKNGQFVIKVGEFEGTPDELLVYEEE